MLQGGKLANMSKSTNIVITGGCNGLGGALVEILRKSNFLLTVIGREAPNNIGRDVNFLKLDLSKDISNWQYSIPASVSQVLFISNAGIIEPIGRTDEIEKKALEKNHNVNFHSPILIASELSKKTKYHNINLRIANISSGAAIKALPNWAAYCSSKAAAKIYLDCLAAEEAHVKVEHIDPGALNTDMQKKIRNLEIELDSKDRIFSKLKANGGLLEPDIAAQNIIKKLIGEQMK